MYGILCKKDCDEKATIPIMKEESDSLATFESIDDAKAFTDGHILCEASEVLFINLETNEVEY